MGFHLFAFRLAPLVLLAVLMHAPPALAQSCEPLSAEAFHQAVETARSRIFLVKYDDALERLAQAEASLSCLTDAVTRESLGNLYLYRGVAAFSKQDEPAALEAFKQAVAVNRSVRWDDRFGQRPREIFIEAKEAALLAPKGTVTIPELKPDVIVYLDGEPNGSSTQLKVQPGLHVLQVKSDQGFVFALLFSVAPEESLVGPVPAEYRASTTVRVSGSDSEGSRGQPDEPPREPRPPREPFDRTKLRPVSYGILGVGGLALLGGAGSGVVSLLTTQTLLNGEYYVNRPDAERDALIERQHLAATLTKGCLAGGAALSATGALLFLLSGSSQSGGDGLVFAPLALPGGGGLAVAGSF